MTGWICSYRKIWENPFFRGNGMRVAIWHWLLHRAAYADTTHKIGGAEIWLKRGEVCFSQQQVCQETGATRKQVRDVLDFLVSSGNAVRIGANERANEGAKVRANARTVLRLEKYEEYQGKDGKGANEGASKGATKGPTKKQGNNIPVGAGADAPAAKDSEAKAPDPAKQAFDAGVQMLGETGLNERKARSLVGKWVSANGPEAVLVALGRAQREGAIEPVSFIEGCLKFSKKKAKPEPGEVRHINGVRKVYRPFDGWVPEYA